jgi:sulfur carrier protein
VNVTLNGEPAAVPEDATVAFVLELLDVEPAGRGVAVALDAEVVPRGRWDATPLHDGARVEVVRAVQGG